MRMAALPVRYIPICLAHLPANQQTWVQINLIAVSESDQEVERAKRLGIVVAGAGLDPGPDKIETNRI